MSRIKNRYIVFATILILILLPWLARVYLAETVASAAMRHAGFSNVVIDLTQLDFEQTRADVLLFSVPTETGWLHVEARNIDITYHEIWKSSVINSLGIDNVSLDDEISANMPPQQPEPEQLPDLRRMIDSARQVLNELAFVNHLSINHISLVGERFGRLNGKDLQLSGEQLDSALQAQLSISDEYGSDGQSRTLAVRLAETGLDAELKLAGKPDAIPASFHLSFDADKIQGDYRIKPDLLQDWLHPLLQLERKTDIGTISGTLLLDLATSEQITAGLSGRTSRIKYGDYIARDVDLQLDLDYAIRNQGHYLRIDTGSYIRAGKLESGPVTMTNTRINPAGELIARGDTWEYSGKLGSELLTLEYEAQTTRFKDIKAFISANRDKVYIDGLFSPADVPGQFSVDIVHDLAAGTGTLDLITPQTIELYDDKHSLGALLSPWPYPFDLLTGTVEVSVSAAWSPREDFRLATTVNLGNAGGHFGDIVFSGLSLSHELNILPELRSVKASQIRLKQLDSGVTASNLSVVAALLTADTGPLPRMVMKNLRGDMFDGTITADELVYDLNSSRNRFLVKANNIDLAKIVETQQLKDIRVTGRIDGTLPVEINESGINIEDGVFINTVRSGTIQYNPGASAGQLQQNPLTGIALNALRDFRYNYLQAGVKYTPQGTLTISLELKGTSPELDTDRPVHLNINTEQNLVSLLKSLRYAEGISEKIDKRVRRQYEDAQNNQAGP